MSEVGIALPRYRCHKEVWALKIERIDFSTETGATLYPEDKAYRPLLVDLEWCRKHNPQAGGYWVQYKDNYISYSPADAFEEGYSLIVPDTFTRGIRAL